MATSSRVTDSAAELIKEVASFRGSGGCATLPQFDGVNVRNVTQDACDAYSVIEAMSSNPFVDPADPFYQSTAQYYRAKSLRSKRCLVAYLQARMSQISEAWWESRDTALPTLTTAEAKYSKEYHDLIVEYMTSFAASLNFRSFILRPPTSQHLTVRGQCVSSFVASSGITYNIQPGEEYTMPYEEAERLIQQGIVIPA